jgi:hypothetical protein
MARTGRYEEEAPHQAGVGANRPRVKRCIIRITENKKGLQKTKWPDQTFSGAAYASLPRTHALLTAGGVPTALRERTNGFLHTPMRPV